jgi:aminoglycoside phosphotransferase (APT) family kinase protein
MLKSDVQRAIEACLDSQALRAHLQTHLREHGAIEAVRITKARRSASRERHPHPLVFSCEIDWHGEATPQRWLGKVHRHGAAAAAAPGSPALHVPELDLLLWPWPLDPGLPQLPALLDPGAVQPLWDAPAARVETLRYEPEKRALLRYTRDDGATLYAKTYADGRAEAVARRFAWMAAHDGPHAPRVAPPLAHGSPETLWQPAVSGTPLPEVMREDGDGSWVQPLAGALAVLHTAPAELAGTTPRSVAHWLREVQRRRTKIARACPELAPQVDAVAEAITQAAGTLPPVASGLIHGDCHPDQVWFDDGRIVLFDFDEFALGDPMEDLAEFLVKWPQVPQGGTWATVWLGAYAQAAPQCFCRTRLAWHMAVQQLLQASRAFVFQVPQWQEQVRARLARAQELAAALDVEAA